MYDYGGPQIASMPSAEYAGFKRCAPLQDADVHATLSTGAHVKDKACINLEDQSTFFKAANESCK